MAEFIHAEEKSGETVFEFINKCDSTFDVGMAIQFKEDGEYRVSVHDCKVIVMRYC